MQVKINYDTKIILSFSVPEILKLLTFFDLATLNVDISEIRGYNNLELEEFIYKLSNSIDRTLEDRILGD